jgi:hypothetical protein
VLSAQGLSTANPLDEGGSMSWGPFIAIAIAVLNVVKESIDD